MRLMSIFQEFLGLLPKSLYHCILHVACHEQTAFEGNEFGMCAVCLSTFHVITFSLPCTFWAMCLWALALACSTVLLLDDRLYCFKRVSMQVRANCVIM